MLDVYYSLNGVGYCLNGVCYSLNGVGYSLNGVGYCGLGFHNNTNTTVCQGPRASSTSGTQALLAPSERHYNLTKNEGYYIDPPYSFILSS